MFGGVQIHGGKENIVDGNFFLDCHAGISFSGWGQKRWLESIQRFLQQASQPPYSNRYPDLAGLKDDADVNIISRNLFAVVKVFSCATAECNRRPSTPPPAGPLSHKWHRKGGSLAMTRSSSRSFSRRSRLRRWGPMSIRGGHNILS